MTTLKSAMLRLDRARQALGYEPMSEGLPSETVRDMLEKAGLTPHADIVDWYSHYGSGQLIYDNWVGELDFVLNRMWDRALIVKDVTRPSPELDGMINWLPIATGEGGATAIWCRPCAGFPSVVHLDEVFDLVPPSPSAITLAAVVTTWAIRCERGFYGKNPYSGEPWFELGAPQDALLAVGL
ncbi:hypothetical protein [Cellulomonas sp.]|uniref:hypothetical protein n=1 Tax=Cellulomonas sp. TaxID=40001 RepID=UPI003BAA230E